MANNNDYYNQAKAVTTSDTVDLPFGLCDALYVGGAGIVVAVLEDNSTVQLTAVAGSILPIRLRRVNATSTTATLMVALYQN